MKNENICKFNVNRSSDIVCSRFVLEQSGGAEKPTKADNYIIHLAVSGEGALHVENRTYSIKTGTIFFVRKGEVYSVNGGDGFVFLYICFYGRRADEVMERIGTANEERVIPGYEKLIPFWQEALSTTNHQNIDLISEAVLLYTLGCLDPKEQEDNRPVSAVVRITADRFTEPDLTLAGLAKQLGYDPKYLSFAFRRERGITYTAYLRNLRIKHAQFLMEQGVTSVKNVAKLSGFKDPLYFSKVFAKEEGVSPREYQREIREATHNLK